MLKKSTILHLRIPFSFFLLPVYMFALAVSPDRDPAEVLLIFVILHLFLYPASNGYNSYFDKDEDSIGGLEKPPPVSKELYYISLTFDLVGLLLGFLIGWEFVVMAFIYGLISKAYSHPWTRWKKYPWWGWFIAGFFQGFFTFLMVYSGLNGLGWHVFTMVEVLLPALLTSMLLWGSYPMTQVYQHKEDSRRGDRTISLRLGVMGTFHFVAAVFTLASFGFLWYFWEGYSWQVAGLFQLFLVPVLFYFFRWYLRVRKDRAMADFRSTMRLNMISAACMNGFFLLLIFIIG